MEIPIRQEIQNVLSALENASDGELLHSLRAVLLSHSVFEELVDSGGPDFRDFQGLTAAIESSLLLAKVDTQGHIVKVNENFFILTGYSQKELIGKSIGELSAGLHDDAYLFEIWDKISHGSIWRGEVKKRSKNGNILWFNATILPVVSTRGDIEHYISLYIDISKRKKAEGDLEMFLQMVNLSNDAIQVADESGKFVYVNERSSINLGYSREELIGKNVVETEQVFQSVEDWKRHVEVVKGMPEGLLVEGINVRKDGSLFPVEVNVRWLELGGAGYIIGVLRDISERRLSERVMQKTQHILSEAQSLAKIASFEIDLDKGTIMHSENAWEVFGFPSSMEFTIENLVNQIHPDDVNRVREAWFEATTHNSSIRIEFRVMSPNTKVHHILGLAQTLSHKDGLAGTMLCTAQNITDTVVSRLKLEERTRELEIRNGELDQFAQIVSHDLKSPLRAIHNLSEWIKESRGRDMQEMDAHIELLQRRIQRMENLINGILSYSSAGRQREDRTYFSALDVVNDICESHRTAGVEAQIIMDDLPDMYEDRLIFEQVMSNLISNAVKHNTNNNPEVIIRYQFIPGMHQFYVEDNGPGIETRFHVKIFQMFQTLSSRDQHENTGVGLAIVKKLCSEKNWRISLKNRPGGGSSFCVEIPQ